MAQYCIAMESLRCTGVNINHSFFRSDPSKLARLESILQEFLDYCSKYHISVVVAAGNVLGLTKDVNENTPQRLSKDTDSMIIVGGVGVTGQRFQGMLPDSSNLVHVYAPGEHIGVPMGGTQDEDTEGTSQSAAIVVRTILILMEWLLTLS
jgi:hypothetical protein